MNLKKKLMKFGNSVGLLLPKPVLEALGWKEYTPINLEIVEDSKVLITRAEPEPQQRSLFGRKKS